MIHEFDDFFVRFNRFFLQTQSQLTLNSKFKSKRRILESNINESNFAKNFFANVDWSILMRFQWVSDLTNFFSFKNAWTRFSSIENFFSYVVSDFWTRKRWKIFYYIRSITLKKFRVYWFNDKISWSCIYVEFHHKTFSSAKPENDC